jgi:WD40 repeat protein
VVTSCDDDVLRVWDATKPGTAKAAREQRLGAPPRRGIFSPAAGQTRLAAASGYHLVVWDAQGTAPARIRKGHNGGVTALAFSPDGEWIATAGADGAAFLWKAADDSPPIALPVKHLGRVLCVAWSAGHLVATGGEDGTIEVWDVAIPEQPTRVAILRGHTGPVWFAAFAPDGRRLLTTSATTQSNADLPSAKGKAAETIKTLSLTADSTARLWDVSSFPENAAADR